MISKWFDKRDEGGLIKFEGTPNDSSNPSELTRWQRFKRAIWPCVREGGILLDKARYLGEAYAEAEVAKRDSKARKFASEAAEAAARADQLSKDTVFAVNAEIRRIFADDESSPEIQMLQFANLLANNPELAAQLENIEELYARLRMLKGVEVIILVGDEEQNLISSSDDLGQDD